LQAQISETAGWLTETSSSRVSDNERTGLPRGLIKTSVEEITFAGTTAADGTQTPELKSWSTTEYDVEGRIMASRARVKQTRRRIYNREDMVETTYNEQGDIVEERTTSAKTMAIIYLTNPPIPATLALSWKSQRLYSK